MGKKGAIFGTILLGPLGGLLGYFLGGPEAPERKYEFQKLKLCHGDVICARRNDALLAYQHFGIFCDGGHVIHFTSKKSDTSSDNRIIETDFDHFKKDSQVFKLTFPDKHDGTIILNPAAYASLCSPFSFPEKLIAKKIERVLKRINEIRSYRLYSPEETVSRARSRIGEGGYDLVGNNCEHFAIWCKTGVHESHQVTELLGTLEFLLAREDLEEDDRIFTWETSPFIHSVD